MNKLSKEEIRKRFEFAGEFNDIFDAFEQALALRIDDIELYKILFWNKSLSPDEVAFFADQLVKQIPSLGYEVYIWLGETTALTLASEDNFEHAMEYYKKAAKEKPSALEPYIKAVLCYDPDIKIPPARQLIEFVKEGVPHVTEPQILYKRLSFLYQQLGNDEMTQYYKRLSGESPNR